MRTWTLDSSGMPTPPAPDRQPLRQEDNMRITLLIDSIDPKDLRDVLGAHQSALLDHDAPASIEATISNQNNGGMVVSICGSAFNAKSVTLDVKGAALMLQELGLRLR